MQDSIDAIIVSQQRAIDAIIVLQQQTMDAIISQLRISQLRKCNETEDAKLTEEERAWA